MRWEDFIFCDEGKCNYGESEGPRPRQSVKSDEAPYVRDKTNWRTCVSHRNDEPIERIIFSITKDFHL